MKAISFLEGVVVALLASVAGSIVLSGLNWMVADDTAWHLVIIGLALAYLLYLFSRSGIKCGCITALFAWFIITVISGLWLSSFSLMLIVQIAAIWLIRSLYFHNGLLTALADLGLNAFALAAALWALQQSGNLGLTLWCFFLVQALFVFLINGKPDSASNNLGLYANANDFQHAYHTAQAAVRKLSSSKL